ncbi:MAG: hypothetical protein DBY25_05690 [Clostridiales bacterium]|nr:MAG: hypothetical protein DBY25_05690 [Clostridiales bacterium]
MPFSSWANTGKERNKNTRHLPGVFLPAATFFGAVCQRSLSPKLWGVDFELAKQLGVKVIWALSLPGKVAPVTSGEIICDTIQNILAERGGCQ